MKKRTMKGRMVLEYLNWNFVWEGEDYYYYYYYYSEEATISTNREKDRA